MTQNSYQSTDDEVRDVFTRYIGMIQGEAVEDGTIPYGTYIDEYIQVNQENGWEGYSDAEIVAIYHFLKDLGTYADSTG